MRAIFCRRGTADRHPTSPPTRRRCSVLVLGARRRGGRRPQTGLRVLRSDLVDQREEEIVILDVIKASDGDAAALRSSTTAPAPDWRLRVRHYQSTRTDAAWRSSSLMCAMSARVSGRALGAGWTLGAGCRAECRGLCRACFRRASSSSFTPRSMAPRARTATATSYLSEPALQRGI